MRTSRNFYFRYVGRKNYISKLIPIVLIIITLILYFARFDNNIILSHLKIRRLYILLEIFMVTLPRKKQDLPEDISDLGGLLGRNAQIYS